MFELFIKKLDGSLYWNDNFNSMEDLNKWLNEEQTRPYWDPTFTTEIVDHTPPPPTPEEVEAETQRLQQISDLKTRLRELDDQNDLTTDEIKECLRKCVKLLRLVELI